MTERLSAAPAALYETARLCVRPLWAGDEDALYALTSDAASMRYMGNGQPLSRGAVQEWLAMSARNVRVRGYAVSAIVRRVDHAFIGFVGVMRAPGRTFEEIIYALAPSARGQGHAQEACAPMFDHVFARAPHLNAIYATIHPANQPSLRLARTLGMTWDHAYTDPDDGVDVQVFVCARPAATPTSETEARA